MVGKRSGVPFPFLSASEPHAKHSASESPLHALDLAGPCLIRSSALGLPQIHLLVKGRSLSGMIGKRLGKESRCVGNESEVD